MENKVVDYTVSTGAITLLWSDGTWERMTAETHGEVFEYVSERIFDIVRGLIDINTVVNEAYERVGAHDTDIENLLDECVREASMAFRVPKARIMEFWGEFLRYKAYEYGLKKEPLCALAKAAARSINSGDMHVATELLKFLEHNSIPLSPVGNLWVFKRVREDFSDVHTGTFDYSPGNIVEIPEVEVDRDPNKTCSKGLHVCGHTYLPHFPGEKIVLCSVSPEDVRAVPHDYNYAKMRCRRVHVVREVQPDEVNDIVRSLLSETGDVFKFKPVSVDEIRRSHEAHLDEVLECLDEWDDHYTGY